LDVLAAPAQLNGSAPIAMSASTLTRPALHKEILVGLLVGGLFGPLVGWLGGMLATFFASVIVDDSGNNIRGMRTTAFVGGLIGIPFGLLIGLVVSLPLRLLSTRVLKLLKNPWAAVPLGAIIGWLCGYVVLICWHPSIGTIEYVGLHSMFVGGLVGIVTVLAKPKWL
jgi:hypothetical protein